jgi:hypothetical protein
MRLVGYVARMWRKEMLMGYWKEREREGDHYEE